MARVVTRVVRRRPGIAYDVFVGRPSEWGNPYAVARYGIRAAYLVTTLSAALRGYETWLDSKPDLVARARRELRGLTLGCFCVDDLFGKMPITCHAQILARIADGAELPIFDVKRKKR